MLDSFDRARQKAGIHEVETYHGKVAEAEFRKWLSSFLPGKYGVTSGYIVSPGLKGTEKTPHFDVIIYDKLESPILWVEDYPDVSPQGRSLAVPVEYVRSVLEVKSRFSPTTVNDAIGHLGDLLPVMGGPDAIDEFYKLYLPRTFCCGVVFFDLKTENQFSETAMSKFVSGLGLRGFFGGLILRGEGHSQPDTGRVGILSSETPLESTIGRGKESLLSGATISPFPGGAEKSYFGSMLTWFESAFAQFAFDLIALMEGRYRPGFLSSFHGMGSSHASDN